MRMLRLRWRLFQPLLVHASVFIVLFVNHASSLALKNPTNAAAKNGQPKASFPMVVVFGRPGAALDRVATQNMDGCLTTTTLGLDLDAYVPQWMKDNFTAGIYPTLQQRQEFARNMCESVREDLMQKQEQVELQRASSSSATTKSKSDSPLVTVAAIISFSFVNNDLRDIFRREFPHASWVLVDTSKREAEKRIQERTGHFYKGVPDELEMTAKTTSSNADLKEDDEDNAEWNFDPVTFPHVVLNGDDPIDTNAEIVVQTLLNSIKDRS